MWIDESHRSSAASQSSASQLFVARIISTPSCGGEFAPRNLLFSAFAELRTASVTPYASRSWAVVNSRSEPGGPFGGTASARAWKGRRPTVTGYGPRAPNVSR